MFYDEKVVNIRNTSITAPVKQTQDINSLFVRKIISYMRDGCKILDIGTGNGFVLKQIYENSDIKSTLTGVDNSKEMVKAARKNIGGIAHIVEGDNNNLPLCFWAWRTNLGGDGWQSTIDRAKELGYTVTIYKDYGYSGQLAFCSYDGELIE